MRFLQNNIRALKILTDKKTTGEIIRKLRLNQHKTGFVPTMGALHKGHISLIEACKKNNEICFCSIFINPTQFNEPEDFQNYPKTLDADIQILKDNGCDYVFIPEISDIYPEGIDKKIHIDLGGLDHVLEGKYRPGHFDGVVTIIYKLFSILPADSAYFGQKDYQQSLVIKKMVDHFKFKVNIHICPIIREKDGLAMSSRNLLLGKKERKLAPVIYDTLQKARNMAKTDKITEICSWAEKKLSGHNLIKVEYFEFLNADTLRPINILEDANKVIICTALKIGKIRLIDNIFV